MSFEKKEQNEVKIFGCVFSLVIIQGKLIRRVMTPISRTYIFDKSTDDFFMKFLKRAKLFKIDMEFFQDKPEARIWKLFKIKQRH